MSARALDALSQLDPLTQLVVGQIYGFTGSGPKSPELVSAEMGLTRDEVSGMLEAGLRALAGYQKKENIDDEESQKKTPAYVKPKLSLVRNSVETEPIKSKIKLAKA